jgi:hypothetical protein
VLAYALGAWFGESLAVASGHAEAVRIGVIVGNVALWASVSEAQQRRARSAAHLALLCAAAACGAAIYVGVVNGLGLHGRGSPEMVLASGAFAVGALRCFGPLAAGIGSQVYIGELLAYGGGLTRDDRRFALVLGLAALAASVLPRLLIAPVRPPLPRPAALPSTRAHGIPVSLAMGLQGAVAALAVVLLARLLDLEASAWAVTAATYVIAGSAVATAARARLRIIGTPFGVALGLAWLPLCEHAPPIAWAGAAIAMIVYAVTLAERYDIACGAFAFVLVVMLAAGGEQSVPLLAARAWETLLGGCVGTLASRWVLPVRAAART